jgi:hypothetical protein
MMKLEPTFYWLAPRLGWKLLNIPRKHNKLYLPKTKNPLLFLTLNAPIMSLRILPSRLRNQLVQKWMNANSRAFDIIVMINIFRGRSANE